MQNFQIKYSTHLSLFISLLPRSPTTPFPQTFKGTRIVSNDFDFYLKGLTEYLTLAQSLFWIGTKLFIVKLNLSIWEEIFFQGHSASPTAQPSLVRDPCAYQPSSLGTDWEGTFRRPLFFKEPNTWPAWERGLGYECTVDSWPKNREVARSISTVSKTSTDRFYFSSIGASLSPHCVNDTSFTGGS